MQKPSFLSEQDIQLVREVQENLPLVSRPFLEIARRLGISEEEVIGRVQEFLRDGILRRFGATLRHCRVGYTANVMVVWRVPEDRVEEVGQQMAGAPEVSHCYERPARAGWPYNLYTMLHGKSRQECEAITARLARESGISEYSMLFSVRELKKSSMRYFHEEGRSNHGLRTGQVKDLI